MTDSIENLAEQATARLAADPATARAFDAAALCTASTRRAAVYASLQAAKAKMAENAALRLRRDATKRRIAALQVATAITSKPATAPRPSESSCKGDTFTTMKSAAKARVQAAAAPRTATTTAHTVDKRQGTLPLSQWAIEHLFRVGITGDAGALDEIRRRGFAIGPHGMSRSMKA